MPASKLLVEAPDGSTSELALPRSEFCIGRDPASDLVIDDSRVSRRHAVIRDNGDGTHLLLDLGSLNGTYVNGRRLEMPTSLRIGDEVVVGGAVLRVLDGPPREADPDPRDPARAAETAGEGSVERLPLIAQSPAMSEVFQLSERAAQTTLSVLIEGETGTGKELVARGIHASSRRAGGPFLAINCAALPEALVETELFGHRRGAFTGATEERSGVFEAASGGTLLLDEIAEMPLGTQPKLLRVLQEGAVSRLGETDHRAIDVRVIAATNRDLAQEVAAKRFRQDLFYRLAAFVIRIPPLRDRRDDIALLAERLARAAARQHGRDIRGIAPAALERLTGYDWPGNVRQLRNDMERAVALAPTGGWIGLEHLTDEVRGIAPPAVTDALASTAPDARADDKAADLRVARAEFEARHIAEVLEQCGGSAALAARRLGLSRSGMHKKLKEYGLLSTAKSSRD